MAVVLPQNLEIVAKVEKELRLGERSPFGVRWYENGQRKRQYFEHENLRDERYNYLRRRARGDAVEVSPRELKLLRTMMSDRGISATEMNAYLAFKAAIGETPISDVLAVWREHRVTSVCDEICGLALKHYLDYLEQQLAAGEIVKGTRAQRKQKVTRFCMEHSTCRLDSFNDEQITEWLEQATDEAGIGSNATFNAYLKAVKDFFGLFCSKDTPLGRARRMQRNPCDKVQRKSEKVDDNISVLPVEDALRLFNYTMTHQPHALGRLALESFVGIRFSTAQRLEKHDIKTEDGGIELPADKIKTGRRFYIDKLPENLWPWLKLAGEKQWYITESQWMHLKSSLFEEAGVPHARNVLRHSFATYHVAEYKNPGATATILCHRNQAKLWSNYYGRGSNADGLRYFAITPESVAEWAKTADLRLTDKREVIPSQRTKARAGRSEKKGGD